VQFRNFAINANCTERVVKFLYFLGAYIGDDIIFDFLSTVHPLLFASFKFFTFH
jgi:hypothetical protein